MRVPTVVGIIAVCVAVSMLITTVDNRIFRRGESSVGAGDRILDSADPTKDSTLTPGSIDDQLWEANRLLTKARNDGETAGRLSRIWHDVLNDLKQGEGAEAIAADPQLVGKLAFLTSEQRVTEAEIQSLNERIHVIQERVDGLSTDQTPLSAREMVEIRELQLVLESARVQWSRAHDQAQAIEQLAVSKMLPKRNPTLDEQLREAAAVAHVDEIERQREIAAQQDAQRWDRIQEIENKKRLEEQKQLELEQRATSPEVTSLLAPFLHPRHFQPRMSGGSLQLRKTFEHQPTSLSALRVMGALDASTDGLKRLAKAGGDRRLSEPKWAVHSQPGNWSDADQAMLREAQVALIDLGPTLVRLGRLSP